MHRFFVPSSWIVGDEVTIAGPQAHQIGHVLRMRPGDEIVILDNSGWEIHTRLAVVERGKIRGRVLRRRLASSEPHTKISLYQGLLRSSRFEFSLQKGTEVGVVEFIPVIADRCVVNDLDAVETKRQRWEWIIQEASEQCRRGRKPALRPGMLFAQACEQARHSGGLSLIPWEGEGCSGLRGVMKDLASRGESSWPPFTINLFIGPEGGFTTAEIDIAQRYGLIPVTLGGRILRAETAGIVAATAILYELGDLG